MEWGIKGRGKEHGHGTEVRERRNEGKGKEEYRTTGKEIKGNKIKEDKGK